MTLHPATMIAVGFLSGSIPFGWIIGRIKGIDIRKHGSGNIGATNLGRLFGFRYFILCFILDVLKGLLPTLAMGWTLGRLGDFEMPARDALWWLGAWPRLSSAISSPRGSASRAARASPQRWVRSWASSRS